MKYTYSRIDLSLGQVTVLGNFMEGDIVFCRRTGRQFILCTLLEEGLSKKIFSFRFIDELDRIESYKDVPENMLPYWFKKEKEEILYEPEFNLNYSFEDVPEEDIPEWV